MLKTIFDLPKIKRAPLCVQKKCLDALNATQETSALNKEPFLKKSWKTTKIACFFRSVHFWGVFLILSETVLCKELKFLALRSESRWFF